MPPVAKMHSSAQERLSDIQETADEDLIARVNLKSARDEPPNSILPESPILYGRENEMEKLGKALNFGGCMAALVSGAGLGKSHCASAFAHKWLQEDQAHRIVVWLESNTENIIRDEYLNALAQVSGGHVVDFNEKITVRDLACLLWEKLVSTQYEWMVVYNNVPQGPEAFSPLFFPTPLQGWGRGRILFTTRSTSYGGRMKCLGNYHVEKISVGPIDESTAMNMLMKDLDDASIPDSERDAAAKETVELFGYLPLAIVSANSQMVAETQTVTEYLNDLKAGLECGQDDAVSLALANALVYAREQELGHVLEVAAFLNPEHLTLELLGCNRETARRLCRLSLLRHAGNDVYTIHRLHQEAVRDGTSPVKSIKVVKNGLKRFDPANSDTWKVGISMLPHLDSLEKNVDAMVKNGSILLENSEKLEYARLLDSNAEILHCVLHHYEKDALSHYKESYELKRQVYGPETKNTVLASTLMNLGILESYLGNNDKARLHLEEAYEMERHVYGPDAKNSVLASTLGNLGGLEMELGNYDKARSHYEEVFEMQLHVFGRGAKNADLAKTLHTLADLDGDLGDYNKARLHLEEALDMERHIYGHEAKNACLASTLGGLGGLAMELGNYDRARMHLEESFEMQRHVYGPKAKNADLALTLGNLGTLEMELGNYDKARSHYEEAFEMQRHVYGRNAKNYDLATTLMNLGSLEGNLGNYEKARTYYKDSLEMKRHVYGPDAKNTNLASTLSNLGILAKKLGRYEEAGSYYEEALEMQRHVYGREAKNNDLATTLMNLGDLEMELGNYEEARLHYQDSLEMKRHVYGPEANNTDLASTLCNVGIIEKELGNYDEARAKLEEALAMAIDSLGGDAPGHPLVEHILKHAQSCKVEPCCAIL